MVGSNQPCLPEAAGERMQCDAYLGIENVHSIAQWYNTSLKKLRRLGEADVKVMIRFFDTVGVLRRVKAPVDAPARE
jgi:hypothetical protein